MASQQAYQAYAQNKGTLVPGQAIVVNKFNVQVERYLSQGGFAHVYLVKTATPVYNTTHHVLKRIAVANEAMLTDVKKEVDIMRLLKGHPNIVHLIDAAWHKMPNGLYEVFILMEFCAGGGIIDMMNRRLRERLTEAEILQIFVDVCEGVAYMHNSRPPLLHRDLKVENILQSTPTSFKLCDFGSATTVAPRPPATTQEIRALETDLSRHTTLQYRAPEMVDPFLRRPVDEKSDVWALGVLLYKLCYYTTPFEEHGPLAILNVQYRIPPYPVYSMQMNTLIGWMLREHGAQRPSVFELLSEVHRLRGTKSHFQYSIPSPQPLSHRHETRFESSSPPNPLDSTISYGSAQQITPSSKNQNVIPRSTSPPKNAGVQAREKVLEAIAPMRRGRPTVSSNRESVSYSRPTSPKKENPQTQTPAAGKAKNWLDGRFDAEEEEAWKAVAVKGGAGKASGGLDDAWNVGGRDKGREVEKKEKTQGFGDDFAENLWDSNDPNAKLDGHSKLISNLNIPSSEPAKATIVPFRTPAFTGTDASRGKQPSLFRVKDKDAFEGLGLGSSSNDRPAPTLAEARKLRTGLATMSSTNMNGYNRYDTSKANSTTPQPSPSPRPSYLLPSQSQPQSLSPVPLLKPSGSGSSWRSPPPASRPNSSAQLDGLPAEARFPSLEELNASFGTPSIGDYTTDSDGNARRRQGQHASSQPQLGQGRSPKLPPRPSNIGSSGTGRLLRPTAQPHGSSGHGHDGIRSEQVTGVAMRESRGSANGNGDNLGCDSNMRRRREAESESGKGSVGAGLSNGTDNSILRSRPVLSRKHRSSISIKHTSHPSTANDTPTAPRRSPPPATGPTTLLPPTGTSASRLSPRLAPKDWLTGDDDDHYPSMSASTSVSSSSKVPVLRDSPSKRASFIERNHVPIQEAIMAQHDLVPPPQPPPSPSAKSTVTTSSITSVSRAARVFPPVSIDTASAIQKEPSEALTDNWSPIAMNTGISAKQKEVESPSSADEGPEDAKGYTPATAKLKEETRRTKRKGRQSSVHDLVDLWGGGVGAVAGPKEKEREPIRASAVSATASHNAEATIKGQKRRSAILPLSSTKSNPRSASPQSALSSPLDSGRSSRRPTTGSSQHRKQPSSGGPRSPVSGRSRPQSMFVFPSKSNSDVSAPPSADLSSAELSGGLSPPEEPKPRANTRRTSISDMVQRYEAIGGKTKAPGFGSGPPVLSKPTALKVTTQTAENGRYSRGRGNSPEASRGNGGVGLSLPVPGDISTRFGEPSKTRISPTGTQTSPGLPRTSNDLRRTSLVGQPEGERLREVDNRAPRLRRTSFNPDNTYKSGPSDIGFPPRNSTISIDEDSSSRSGDGQPPSPERPYQGVGKLIDQWQRKTAEINSSRNPVGSRRGGVVANVGERQGR